MIGEHAERDALQAQAGMGSRAARRRRHSGASDGSRNELTDAALGKEE